MLFLSSPVNNKQMKKILLAICIVCTLQAVAQKGAGESGSEQDIIIDSPDKKLSVKIFLNRTGTLGYNVTYNKKQLLEDSPLGMITDVSDFSKNLKLSDKKESVINKSYTENRIKKSRVDYHANEIVCTYETPEKEKISLIFRVSNNDIAFKYSLARNGKTARCIVEKELSGFKFPLFTTTFLTSQATPMIGRMKTKPSYEEEYTADEPVRTVSAYGLGYTFPALFHIGDNGWALISETGVNSLYCGSILSESSKNGLYTIVFPEPEENNGIVLNKPAISLPGETTWRTITVGDNLKPIVETTIPFDVADPLYKPSTDYKFGRSTRSWIMWQDNSMNYEDQVTYIDLAAQLGYEYILIDALWDKQIGYNRMAELLKYARSKNVDAFLWCNSNGYSNDAPQTPKNCMNTSVARKKNGLDEEYGSERG